MSTQIGDVEVGTCIIAENIGSEIMADTMTWCNNDVCSVLHGQTTILNAIADSAQNILVAQNATQVALANKIGDSAQVILAQQGELKQQLGQVGQSLTDSLHVAACQVENAVHAEGRNLDNKVCDVEHAVSDSRAENLKSFADKTARDDLNTFNLSNQIKDSALALLKEITNSEARSVDRFASVLTGLKDVQCLVQSLAHENKEEVLRQFCQTREEANKNTTAIQTQLSEAERRCLEKELADCKAQIACKNSNSETFNIINSQIANALGPIVQQLTQLTAALHIGGK